MKNNNLKKINIGGLFFDNVNMSEAINLMEKRINEYKGRESSLLCVANQDIINKVKIIRDLTFKRINEGSFLIIPDGNSIVYASKLLGTPLKERVAGPDLMERFIEVAANKGYRNFFLGAKEGVAWKMGESFLKKFPNLKISGIYSPPFGDFSKNENEKIINMVNKSKSDILWVSFGCPKQETWILNYKEKLNVPISAGIGAAFDFLSGRVKRAPKIIQKLKLEWFYRFLQEPFRLWERYFIGGFRFIKIIIQQKYSRKKNK
jgi:N-acetylglucosaminyldiphosphoundecaprenol N-acetyl-beta-D-mannosaminyltransferase